jgi:hypothetical protein
MKYRKKPVIIDAVQWRGNNFKEIELFTNSEVKYNMMGQEVIKTLEGDLFLTINDFIIKGIKGEFYPCKPDIFEKTYEAIKE